MTEDRGQKTECSLSSVVCYLSKSYWRLEAVTTVAVAVGLLV
jgi:hypothetical protein